MSFDPETISLSKQKYQFFFFFFFEHPKHKYQINIIILRNIEGNKNEAIISLKVKKSEVKRVKLVRSRLFLRFIISMKN